MKKEIMRHGKKFVYVATYPNYLLFARKDIPQIRECFLKSELGIITIGDSDRLAKEKAQGKARNKWRDTTKTKSIVRKQAK